MKVTTTSKAGDLRVTVDSDKGDVFVSFLGLDGIWTSIQMADYERAEALRRLLNGEARRPAGSSVPWCGLTRKDDDPLPESEAKDITLWSGLVDVVDQRTCADGWKFRARGDGREHWFSLPDSRASAVRQIETGRLVRLVIEDIG